MGQLVRTFRQLRNAVLFRYTPNIQVCSLQTLRQAVTAKKCRNLQQQNFNTKISNDISCKSLPQVSIQFEYTDYTFYNMGHSRPLFSFRLFNKQLTVNCSIKVAGDWIRTRVVWYMKRPHCQLSHSTALTYCPVQYYICFGIRHAIFKFVLESVVISFLSAWLCCSGKSLMSF